jgi:ABC-type multidrug transport system ATPase subunit
MDLVAEKKHDGYRTGVLKYGGNSVIKSKSDIAYVQTTDVHIGEFTVLENLYYAALLRLGGGVSHETCMERIRDSAVSVGIEHILNVHVGTELIKGISGGQKKRLSIATELLALPSVLCLDEPTSGF